MSKFRRQCGFDDTAFALCAAPPPAPTVLAFFRPPSAPPFFPAALPPFLPSGEDINVRHGHTLARILTTHECRATRRGSWCGVGRCCSPSQGWTDLHGSIRSNVAGCRKRPNEGQCPLQVPSRRSQIGVLGELASTVVAWEQPQTDRVRRFAISIPHLCSVRSVRSSFDSDTCAGAQQAARPKMMPASRTSVSDLHVCDRLRVRLVSLPRRHGLPRHDHRTDAGIAFSCAGEQRSNMWTLWAQLYAVANPWPDIPFMHMQKVFRPFTSQPARSRPCSSRTVCAAGHAGGRTLRMPDAL